MTKVKIVQIAVAIVGNNADDVSGVGAYLDDKGRVWYPETTTEGMTEWKQLDLPDEPGE